MSKATYEIAAELTQELIKAKSQIIAGINHVPTQQKLLDECLSDDAVTKTYGSMLNKLNTP